MYPDVKYDGGLFCSLVHDDNPPKEKKYPPGTEVEQLDPFSISLVAGTVIMDIPLSGIVSETSDAPHYTIHDSLYPHIIPSPPVRETIIDVSHPQLPPFLQLNSKITCEGVPHNPTTPQHGSIQFYISLS
jgi:hypothetical protein